jgi:hypothetical protein
MMELARRMAEPARHALVSGGIVLGTGVVQMAWPPSSASSFTATAKRC